MDAPRLLVHDEPFAFLDGGSSPELVGGQNSPHDMAAVMSGDFVNTGHNALIFGNNGTGKSHLANLVLEATAARQKQAILVNGDNAPAALAKLFMPPDDKAPVLREDVLLCDLLILDELPTFSLLHAQGLLQLIKARFCFKRSTLITSRVPADTWVKENRFGESTAIVLACTQMGIPHRQLSRLQLTVGEGRRAQVGRLEMAATGRRGLAERAESFGILPMRIVDPNSVPCLRGGGVLIPGRDWHVLWTQPLVEFTYMI